MASETELETLLVRLTGDGSEFQAMIQETEHKLEHATHVVETHTKEIEGFFAGIAGKAKLAVEAFAVFETLKESFKAFSEAEEATIRLTAAIETSGRAAAPLVNDYKKFAAEISHHTLVTKNEVLAMAELTEALGFTGAKAKQLIEDSIGLGTALKMDSEQALNLVIGLERGNVQMLRRVHQLRGIKDEAKLVRQAEKLMEQGIKTAGLLSNTAAGQLTHLGHEFHGLFMELGGLLARGLNPVISGLRQLVEWIGNLHIVNSIVDNMKQPWANLKEAVGLAWDWAKQKTSEFIEFVQPITDALISFFDAAWDGIKEGASALWEFTKDVFQEAVDAVNDISKALGIDWKVAWEIMRDAVQTAILFMEFSIKNFKAEANLVWDAIALGLSQAFDFMRDAGVGFLAFMNGLGASLTALFLNSWNAIKNPSVQAFKDIGKGTGKAFDSAFDSVVAKYGAGDSPLTKQLKADYDKQKGILNQSFDDFRKEKLSEFEAKRDILQEEDEVEASADKKERGRRQEQFKEISKFDAALSNSTEARARIAEQKDRLDPKHREGNFDKTNVAVGSVQGSQKGSADALKKVDTTNELLRKINENTIKKPGGVNLEAAGLI